MVANAAMLINRGLLNGKKTLIWSKLKRNTRTLLGHLCVLLILAANVWQDYGAVQLQDTGDSPTARIAAFDGGSSTLAILPDREHGAPQTAVRHVPSGILSSQQGVVLSGNWSIVSPEALPHACLGTLDSLLSRGCLLTI